MFSYISNGQTDEYRLLIDSAKTIFKSEVNLYNKEIRKTEYKQVINLVEKALELDPNNSEAYYFLGYAYSKFNSGDANDIIDMDLELLMKTSELFEKVITLSPKYEGELLILDPHSKISSEWGAMALNYLYQSKQDSAKWALKEGKSRGGFSDYFLSISRIILNSCDENAILISSGDNFSFPLLYLQNVENYRLDVKVIDISLLSTNWFYKNLEKKNEHLFDMPPEYLDSIQYIEWSDSVVSINNFLWTVKPTYSDSHLLRGDILFLSLLRKNNFQLPIYFTIGFYEPQRLNLKEFLSSLVIVDKLTLYDKDEQTYKEYKSTITNLLNLSNQIDLNNPDELFLLDFIRIDVLKQIDTLLTNKERRKSRQLFNVLNDYADYEKFPYQSENNQQYYDYIRQRL